MNQANRRHVLPGPHSVLLPWYDRDGYKQRSVMTFSDDLIPKRAAVAAIMKFYYVVLGVSITKAEAKDLMYTGVNGYIKHERAQYEPDQS